MQLNAQQTRLILQESCPGFPDQSFLDRGSRTSCTSRMDFWVLFTGNYVQLGDHGAITHRFFSSLSFFIDLYLQLLFLQISEATRNLGITVETVSYSFPSSFFLGCRIILNSVFNCLRDLSTTSCPISFLFRPLPCLTIYRLG